MRLARMLMRNAAGLLSIAGALMILFGPAAYGQQSDRGTAADGATLASLLERINQLEARVSELEASQRTAGAACVTSPATTNPSAADPADATSMAQASPAARTTKPSAAPPATAASTHPEVEQDQAEGAASERMDLSKTLLRIRGFGDVSLHGDTAKGDTTSFSLGQLDLFVTSDISEKFKFLSEIVFEGGPDNLYGVVSGVENSFSVDVERYLLQYSQSDYFNLSAGRFHTAIGYYNTAYHHSTWLQTTTGRPFLYAFEDEGGILPIHLVGVSASGQIPSGGLRLHYVAEVGNGRESKPS